MANIEDSDCHQQLHTYISGRVATFCEQQYICSEILERKRSFGKSKIRWCRWKNTIKKCTTGTVYEDEFSSLGFRLKWHTVGSSSGLQ